MVDVFGVPKLKKSHSFLNQWQYQRKQDTHKYLG